MKKILIPSSIATLIIISTLFFINSNRKSDDSQSSTTPQSQKTSTSNNTITSKTKLIYKDGSYSGNNIENAYGYVQVEAVVSGGKISDIKFLNLPNEAETSQYINSQAAPLLKQEVITSQSSNVDIISGATATSEAFNESLISALSKAT